MAQRHVVPNPRPARPAPGPPSMALALPTAVVVTPAPVYITGQLGAPPPLAFHSFAPAATYAPIVPYGAAMSQPVPYPQPATYVPSQYPAQPHSSGYAQQPTMSSHPAQSPQPHQDILDVPAGTQRTTPQPSPASPVGPYTSMSSALSAGGSAATPQHSSSANAALAPPATTWTLSPASQQGFQSGSAIASAPSAAATGSPHADFASWPEQQPTQPVPPPPAVRPRQLHRWLAC
jgi:hypothetical protein